MRFTAIVLTLVLLFAAGSAPAQAQQGQGGGSYQPATRQQACAMFSRFLDRVHGNPSIKARVLDRFRRRMATKGFTDLDRRMARIGQILDRVAHMSDAEYAQKRDAITKRIMRLAKRPGMARRH